MACSAEEERSWSNLPEEVVSLILVRLPLAAQARLCCVCKQWRSIVHSQELQDLRSLMLPSRKPWFVFLAAKGSASRQRHWLAGYDPADEQWHRLALKLDDSNRTRVLVASVGSILCFATVNRKVFQGSTVWICNPFTGCKKMLPPPPSRFFSHEADDPEDLHERFQAIVMDPSTGGFRILVEGFYRTLDTYDSISNEWTTTSMDLPSVVEFSISRPIRDGLLYCLAKNPKRVVIYDVRAGIWMDPGTMIDSSVECTRLLEHKGEVLMVGAVTRSLQEGEGGKIVRIGIWKLSILDSVWEEMECMPTALQDAYLEKNYGNSLYFVGQGDLIYFTSVPRSSNKSIREPLVYNLSVQAWYWVPEYLMSSRNLMRRKRTSPPVWRSAFGLPNMLACEASLLDAAALV
ncbi:hypothetical protein O6H91_01G050500 [Diphasiastrum complanatum]|uniref:Uncharacterized protein n=1 Tax=Diphasiastrum complanatum TaxID=34168 RepID=A0ACC2ER29_DIPCM|nr:hypothetical protein O6H91_Y228700 [Diphasiastrum complanatum]KAJ7568853.1 hypothetical protein O6H91_01G050500 [Diphasiastrum complanatum]